MGMKPVGNVRFSGGGRDSKKWFEEVKMIEWNDGDDTPIRMLGGVLHQRRHWLKSKKGKGFPLFCLNWDTDTEKATDNGCPMCEAKIPVQDIIIFNAIDRTAQDSGSNDYLRVAVFPPTAFAQLAKVQKMKKGRDPSHKSEGFDIHVLYDSKAKTAAQYYQLQGGDDSPLSKEEKKLELYPLDELCVAEEYNDCADAVRNMKEGGHLDGDDEDDFKSKKKGKFRDDDEKPKKSKTKAKSRFNNDDDDDDDDDDSKKFKPGKGARIEDDEDEDDEDEKPKKSKAKSKSKSKFDDDDDDEDEDEDEKPKKSKSKSKFDDDDDDEDEKPKAKSKSKSKSKFDDDDEDDDDEDEEDEKPKKSKSKSKFDDDDDDEDEKPKKSKSKFDDDEDEDEDEKPKKSKSKSKFDDDEDEDEKPKKSKSKSKFDDDEDDGDARSARKPIPTRGESRSRDRKPVSKRSRDDDDDDDDEPRSSAEVKRSGSVLNKKGLPLCMSPNGPGYNGSSACVRCAFVEKCIEKS